MKHYGSMAAAIAGFVLVGFLAVQWLGIEWLSDPTGSMQQGAIWAAMIGGGLLLADVFIPVPSSLVMIAHGAILGVWLGFCISLLASLGGAMLGWWVGRHCKAWVSRSVSESDQRRALQLFECYGIAAIVISRMLPIVSETVSIMAGITGMGGKRVAVASALGSVPPSFIYAVAGAWSVNTVNGAWIAGTVFLIAGLSGWISLRLSRRSAVESD